ncbi:ribonuclease III [Rippkaea orientalis PCC 8801]|uniref:Mini-ribonuclease 3 n=2 Tax=Rippkaea TaxID=2546365 RepID=B7K2P3_RIPO1|nr:ribonuclease III [Rippkaea orientalis PCC 8801]
MNLPHSDLNQSLFLSNDSLPNPGVMLESVGLDPSKISSIGQVSPAFLAYLGDAVYELYIRTYYLLPPRRLVDYHNQVVSFVRAETQAALLEYLKPYLTDAEREIVRRGRNAATGKPRRLSPEIYQQATSLETLIGYLYLHNQGRLTQLLEKLNLSQLT